METPAPGSQAAQSAAYRRLRADADQLASLFNTPMVTHETGRAYSAAPVVTEVDRPVHDTELLARMISEPAPATLTDMLRENPLMGSATSRPRRDPPTGTPPEIHRIKFQHLYKSQSVYVHVSVMMPQGNVRPSIPNREYPQISPVIGGVAAAHLDYAYGVYGASLLRAVLPVIGVTFVQVLDVYQFKIEKGEVFSWNEVIPRVAYYLSRTWEARFGTAPDLIKEISTPTEVDQGYDVYEIVRKPPTPAEEKPMLRRFDLGGPKKDIAFVVDSLTDVNVDDV